MKIKVPFVRLDLQYINMKKEIDDAFVKAAQNIPLVDVLPQQGINVYDILRRDVLVLSKDAAAHLEERLK